MPSQREAKRKAWFEFGTRAVAQALPEAPLGYRCPLCVSTGRVFVREDLEKGNLTVDHVPPAKLGGRELVLTCRDCNSIAGHQVDQAMLAMERLLDFGLGTLSASTPVRVRLGEHVLRANLVANGDGMSIIGVPAANPPEISQRLGDEFERLCEGGEPTDFTVNMTFEQRFNYRMALVGWLRAAYLAAFAALGYRYIFHPKLRLVRQQLASPSAVLIENFSVTVPDASVTTRRMVVVREPNAFRSVLVQMGRHVVFLPALDDDYDVYQYLLADAERNRRLSVTFRGGEIPWPRKPEYALDLLVNKG